MSKRSFLVLLVLCLAISATTFLISSRAQEMAPGMEADTSLGEPDTSVAMDTGIIEEKETLVDRMRRSGVVDLYVRGGVFMHPILICSILGVAVIIERAYTVSKAGTDAKKLVAGVLQALRKDGTDGAREILEKTKGPVAAVLHAGLLRAEMGVDAVERSIVTAAAIETSFLERGLIWLASVANIAPLIGFLGTVSGMIHAFEAIAAADQVSAKLVASGISEALITTASGLIVAIPVQAAYNYFVQRVDRFSVEMEESSADLLDALSTAGASKAHKA